MSILQLIWTFKSSLSWLYYLQCSFNYITSIGWFSSKKWNHVKWCCGTSLNTVLNYHFYRKSTIINVSHVGLNTTRLYHGTSLKTFVTHHSYWKSTMIDVFHVSLNTTKQKMSSISIFPCTSLVLHISRVDFTALTIYIALCSAIWLHVTFMSCSRLH